MHKKYSHHLQQISEENRETVEIRNYYTVLTIKKKTGNYCYVENASVTETDSNTIQHHELVSDNGALANQSEDSVTIHEVHINSTHKKI